MAHGVETPKHFNILPVRLVCWFSWEPEKLLNKNRPKKKKQSNLPVTEYYWKLIKYVTQIQELVNLQLNDSHNVTTTNCQRRSLYLSRIAFRVSE